MHYLGVDVGSVSVKFALIDQEKNVIDTLYMRNHGVIPTVKKGMAQFREQLPSDIEVSGVGATGSGAGFSKVLIGADVHKTEILAHAIGTLHFVPDVSVIFEIGGEDSKVIFLRNGIITGFEMNRICSGGAGAFLDSLAGRLNIPISDVGHLALERENEVSIASRCTVFATTDAVHKLNSGYRLEDVLMGVCNGLVRNYLAMLYRKVSPPPYTFQGATSRNVALRYALEQQLGAEVIVPPYAACLGAFGAAILALENGTTQTRFKGFQLADFEYQIRSFICQDCENHCEITQILQSGEPIASNGSRCGKRNF
ncbi:MAG: 2-hydroxyglutaryl-CoA dehydratase [Chloroflexi bacterium B3_Chlor]|nr:MAG: 2-hydroxyglutaryl-CoA dehydratase [Chloroflexi bacterium B3_Chlor]